MNKWEVDLGVLELIVVYVSYCFSLSCVFRLYGDIRILSKYFTILGPECEMNSKHFLAPRVVIDCHKHATFSIIAQHSRSWVRSCPRPTPPPCCWSEAGARARTRQSTWISSSTETRKINRLRQSFGLETHLSFVINITYFIDHKLELIIPRQWFVLQVVI